MTSATYFLCCVAAGAIPGTGFPFSSVLVQTTKARHIDGKMRLEDTNAMLNIDELLKAATLIGR
jgi:hypothetical protein